MSSNLAMVRDAAAEVAPILDREKKELVKQTILKGATDLELELFTNLCNSRQLDPFKKEVYGIKTGQGLQMFASIDGLRVIAQRSGEYAGQVGPFWCGTDGEWVDVWLQQEKPSAAKVGVLRRGWTEPMWGVATLKSYGKNSPIWGNMPDIMLAKCAESLALRKAFPDAMSGLYVREEMPDERGGHVAVGRTHEPVYANLKPGKPAEVVNADTGEIITKEGLGLRIRELRVLLGWNDTDVRNAAAEEGFSLRSVEGLRDMVLLLERYVDEAFGEDGEEGQSALPIDADFAPINEAGEDGYTS